MQGWGKDSILKCLLCEHEDLSSDPIKIWAEQNGVPLSLGETANNPGIVEAKAD